METDKDNTPYPSHSAFDSKLYKLLLECLGDEIFVTDRYGKVIFINPASAKIIGLPVHEIIGHNVADLQRDGYFSVSCTAEVLRTKNSVNVIQKLTDGRTLLATGVPIYDDDGNIDMIISTSKDVKELNKLLDTLQQQNKKLVIQTEELNLLREEIFIDEGFISSSKCMKEIKNTVLRIAPLDMTVLVEGETGVGKEVVVKSLHKFSNRSNEPFIKINCGMIPENLIESELFGYEGGSFTNALKEGKMGKIELANHGTLFLDEIGEMPLSLQVRLLDFLQDGTIVKVGGTKRIKINARVIAATNRDLKKLCAEGQFRQDLYYRLNVIPLQVPPLRDRLDDIEMIARYYLSVYNSKYRGDKRFEENFSTFLMSYDWPGNIRELSHILERLYVMTEDDVLSADALNELLHMENAQDFSGKIFCSGIIPLKEAKQEIEKHLVTKAYKIYHSTYKVADVLKVDQSTIVKIMKKYRPKEKG